MKHLFGDLARQAAEETGFGQRRRVLTGERLAQVLTLGWLRDPRASREALAQTASALAAPVSAQAIHQRLSQTAALFLERLLGRALGLVVAVEPVGVAERFSAVYLLDSSTVTLPDALAAHWAGCGGGGPEAAVKLQVRLELRAGELAGPYLEPGRASDRATPLQHAVLPAGSLRVADLGYFTVETLEAISQDGGFWLTRVQAGTKVVDERGRDWALADFLEARLGAEGEARVWLGATRRLACRLLARRASPDVVAERRRKLHREAKRAGKPVSRERLALAAWTVWATNAPPERLGVRDALTLGRARWQIELLFKLWKQHGQIDTWRSEQPWPVLCECYAKLLAMVAQHWLLLATCWGWADRSMVKGAQVVRGYALLLTSGMAGEFSLVTIIREMGRAMERGCRLNKRRKRPSTVQLLQQLSSP